MKKNCESKDKCYLCKSNAHHTAICDKNKKSEQENDKNETESPLESENSVSTNVVNSKTAVFLQTASAYIFDNLSDKKYVVKILLDPGSQQTYISQRIAERLNLTPINNRNMSVKVFGTDKVNYMPLNEYNFSLMGIKTKESINLKGFAIPLI